MTIDGIILAANKIYSLFGNLENIRDIEYSMERIIFKTAGNWYAYDLDNGTVTVCTNEDYTVYN